MYKCSHHTSSILPLYFSFTSIILALKMPTKKQICLKMDGELLKSLDELEGSRTDNIHLAVQMYLQRAYPGNTDVYTEVCTSVEEVSEVKSDILEAKVHAYAELIKAKDEHIKTLQVQNGLLSSEYLRISRIALPDGKKRWLQKKR
jgi:hypothetical protein